MTSEYIYVFLLGQFDKAIKIKKIMLKNHVESLIKDCESHKPFRDFLKTLTKRDEITLDLIGIGIPRETINDAFCVASALRSTFTTYQNAVREGDKILRFAAILLDKGAEIETFYNKDYDGKAEGIKMIAIYFHSINYYL